MLQRVLFIDYIILCYFIRKPYLNLSYKIRHEHNIVCNKLVLLIVYRSKNLYSKTVNPKINYISMISFVITKDYSIKVFEIKIILQINYLLKLSKFFITANNL